MCPNPLGQSKHFPQSFSDFSTGDDEEHPNVKESFKTKVTIVTITNITFAISVPTNKQAENQLYFKRVLSLFCTFFMEVTLTPVTSETFSNDLGLLSNADAMNTTAAETEMGDIPNAKSNSLTSFRIFRALLDVLKVRPKLAVNLLM